MLARGYSLVEMTVVLGILAVLLAFATPRCRDLLLRYRIESQTRTIHGELLQARANSLYLRRVTRIRLYPDRFEVYSTATDGAAPINVQQLAFPITPIGNSGVNVDFDERGIALSERSICVDGSTVTGALDGVVVAKTRLSLGKKDRGDECKSENITKY